MKRQRRMNTHERLDELMQERIAVVPYDADWPLRYAALELRLMELLPTRLVQRIAHIGSTAVPGLSAKPIIDVQVEVSDLDEVRERVVPVLEAEGYEFIWRPSIGESAPFYAWFIKRNEKGERTEHLHMVAPDRVSAERITFRDILRKHPVEAAAYEELKRALAIKFARDRAGYSQGKTGFIRDILVRGRSGNLR